MLGTTISPFSLVTPGEATAVLGLSAECYKTACLSGAIKFSVNIETIAGQMNLHNFWDLLEFMFLRELRDLRQPFANTLSEKIVEEIASSFDSRDGDGLLLQLWDVEEIVAGCIQSIFGCARTAIDQWKLLCHQLFVCYQILLSSLETALQVKWNASTG